MDAKRGPILFRCDGTPDLGWEPLYQCLSLAAALQRRRRGTHFLSYLDPLSLAQVINRGNNDWVPAEAAARRRPATWTPRSGGPPAERRRGRRRRGRGDRRLPRELRPRPGRWWSPSTPTPAPTFPGHVVVNPLLAPARKAYRVEPRHAAAARPQVRPGPRGVPPAADDPGDRAAGPVPGAGRVRRRRPGRPDARSGRKQLLEMPKVDKVQRRLPDPPPAVRRPEGLRRRLRRPGRGRDRAEGADDPAGARPLRPDRRATAGRWSCAASASRS